MRIKSLFLIVSFTIVLMVCCSAAPVWSAPFTGNGNGTVTDNKTGLIWQQGEPGSKTWANALTYCEGLSLGGQTDWRLPNIKELESITDDTRYNPAMDTTYFPNAYASYYWSSTTYAYLTSSAWGVDFSYGYVVSYYKTYNSYVRCVRAGQSGSLGNSAYFTVTDSSGNAITDKAVNAQFQVKATARNADGSVKTGWSGKVNISANGLSKSYILITSGGTATATIFIDTPGNAVQIKAMGGGMSGNSNVFNVTGTACYGSIGGKVTQGGTDLTGATVYLTSSSYSPSPATSSGGSYSFTNVPAGSYTLRATYTYNGGESREIPVTVGCSSAYKDIHVYQQCNLNEKTPVLLVPGIMGSTTSKSIIPTLPRDKSPAWIDTDLEIYDTSETDYGWKNIRSILTSNTSEYGYKEDCTLFDAPYDWRKDNDTIAEEYLSKWITYAKVKSGSPKVNIIAHSQGGLVTRAYIQGSQYKNDIDRFAMIATPNHGSTKAYYLWEGADPETLDETVGGFTGFTYQAAVNKLVFGSPVLIPPSQHGSPLDISRRQKIYEYINTNENVLSLKQLMPTYSFLDPYGNTGCETNSWLNSLNSSGNISRLTTETDTDTNKVRTKLFYSNSSNKTIQTVNVRKKDCSRLFYPDGEPRNAGFSNAGDKTVLASSAELSPAEVTITPNSSKAGEHSKLVNTYAFDAITFINYGQSGASVAVSARKAESAVSSLSIAVTGRAQPLLMSPAGQKSGIDTGVPVSDIPGTTQSIGVDAASISIESPADGTYTITMSGIYNEDYSLIIEYVSAAGESSILSVRGFNHANTTSFTFTLNSAATDKLTMNHTPLPPANLQADAIDSGGLKTRLSWDVVTGAVSYIIYGKNSDEPYLQQIGTTTGLSFDTGDAWAADSSVTTREYAVSAVSGSGSESFLSNIVENNDRDHDGLTDTKETSLATNVSNPDSDGDGLKDGDEYIRGTNPLLTDTDSDGYSDYAEVQAGTDPLDAASKPTCTYTISPTSKSFTSTGGTGSVTVTPSASSCTWTATESLSWVTITSGSSGTGSGTVSYTVSANATGAARTGTMTIAGQTLTITQEGGTSIVGTWTLERPCGNSVKYSWYINSSGTFSDNAGSGGTWTLNGDQVTLSYSDAVHTTYRGTVYSAGTYMSGTASIDSGATSSWCANKSSCTYTISPTSKSFTSTGGTGSVTVTPSASSCTWTASESLSWVSINSGSSGTGSGTVSYTVSTNATGAARTGNITIAGQTFTITQTGTDGGGIVQTITPPTTTTVSKGGVLGPFSVTTTNNGTSSSSFSVYVYIRTPDETWHQIFSNNVTMAAGATNTISGVYFGVPANAQTGGHYYQINLYDTSGNLIDYDGFSFTVSSASTAMDSTQYLNEIKRAEEIMTHPRAEVTENEGWKMIIIREE